MSELIGFLILVFVLGLGVYAFYKARPQDFGDLQAEMKKERDRLNEIDKPKE